MSYVIITAQLMLSLSILIVLHEMGHFFPARWFQTRVEKFYLFFDPYFSLFKYKSGDTEYGIGWLPLGGYVKISGMIDESMDKEQMKQPPQPWEFRSKPAWQRLIIMLGGVTVNFVLGLFLFAMVLFVWGEEYLPNERVTMGIHVDSLGMDMGLQNGDKVLAVGDVQLEKFNDRQVVREIVINNANSLTIERDGREQKLSIDEKFVSILSSSKNKDRFLFVPRLPFVINELGKDGPAKEAGLQKGDKIIAVNNQPTPFYDQFQKMAEQNKGKAVDLTLIRTSDTLTKQLTLTEDGKVGAYRESPQFFYDLKTQEYSLGEAIPLGITRGWGFLADQVKAFGQMFKGKIKVTESLGGFGTIAGMFGDTWEWQRFWRMTGILSLILAFMNLLPIPALDGGHVMFLLYEVVSGRKPSDRFMEIATIIGFVLVLGLVIFANGMDLIRAIRG